MRSSLSIKHVLKSTKKVFIAHLNDHLSDILREGFDDLMRLHSSGKLTQQYLRGTSVRAHLSHAVSAASGSLVVISIFPNRMSLALSFLKNDLFFELDKIQDQKQKKILCLKVIGALTTASIGTFYQFQKGPGDIFLIRSKLMNTFNRFVFGQILFRLTCNTVLRFLIHLESQRTESDGIDHVMYFRKLLEDPAKSELDNGSNLDPAIQIITNFKKFIMTGKR